MTVSEAMNSVELAMRLGVPAEIQAIRGQYGVVIKNTVIVYDVDKAEEFIRVMGKAVAVGGQE